MNHKQLALIHVLKNKSNLDENAYRSTLWKIFEVNSSKDLSPAQASDLIDWMKRQIPSYQVHDYNNNFLSNTQHRYILYLSRNNVTNLRAFCSKIVHRKWRQGASYSDLSQEFKIKERWIRAIITIILKQRNTNT